MIDFIVKYWVQFFFGLIAACATWTLKKYYDLVKKDRENEKKELKEEIVKTMNKQIEDAKADSDKCDNQLKAEIEVLSNSMDNIANGLLSIQGREFRNQCKALLDYDHVITADEYEQLSDDHMAYKALGGNHKGDTLFASVEVKFNAQVTNGKNIGEV